MHSILYALAQFDAKAYVVGPPEMSLLPEFTIELDERNVEYEVAESVEECIAECDVIYMEPVVQPDYTSRATSTAAARRLTPAEYKVTRELLREQAKHSAIVLHSLPRMDELPDGRRRDAACPLLAGGVQRRRDADGAARPRAGCRGVKPWS